jgi:hypothetical protein
MAEEKKIVQFMIGPNNAMYQGQILGLGNDGAIYYAHHDGTWHKYFDNTFTPEIEETEAH